MDFKTMKELACMKDELRKAVYAVLDVLPVDLLVEYAYEKLNLMTHDDFMDQGAGASEMRREC